MKSLDWPEAKNVNDINANFCAALVPIFLICALALWMCFKNPFVVSPSTWLRTCLSNALLSLPKDMNENKETSHPSTSSGRTVSVGEVILCSQI